MALGYYIYDPEVEDDPLEAGVEPRHHRPALGHARRGPVPGLLGLQLLPRLRERLRPQHPALHRQPRLPHRQLGPAPAQRPAERPRDVRQLRPDHRAAQAPRDRVPAALHPARPHAALPGRSTAPSRTSTLARPNSYEGSYGRFDAFPQLTLPIRSFPWLSLSLSAGERLTWYSDSLDSTQRAFSGESLTRDLPVASAEVIGPSFSRIFSRKLGGFGQFKHIVEPRFTYVYNSGFDDENLIPLFDEVDRPFSRNRGRLALVNRVLGKPEGSTGSAREIFLFELSRDYSFDDEQPLERGQGPDGLETDVAGPLQALLRFNPSDRISFKLEAEYSLLFSGLGRTGFTGSYGFGQGNYLGATWFTGFDPASGESLSNQVRLNAALAIPFLHLQVEGQINYDFEEQLLQQQTLVMNYTSQCYGLRLELRDFRAGEGPRTRDKDIRLSLTLKNVGTFLDLTSRSSTSEQP